MKKRQSGVLMHISSLPGAYGIGSFGKSAYDFVDFLVRTKQRYWQILPLGTTSYGDSPYQSFSAFAGNTHFIDLDILVEQGLLQASDLEGVDFGSDASEVDYAKIYYARRPLLEKAVKRFLEVGDVKDFEKFAQDNQSWLELFAEYMAIKEHFDNLAWTEWPDADARARKASVLESYREQLADKLVYHRVTQYFFFQQWLKLKDYANDNHIEIVGDMPIYVAEDSSDMWANPHLFKTDVNGKATCIAGCPPDEFSATGQLWGNPIYDWEAMDRDGYKRWIERLRESFKIYDIVRIDHFRGFAAYWEIPAGATDATGGEWVKGPGFDLFEAVKNELGDLPIIAEDLGFMDDAVIELREATGFPGMKILEFGFMGSEPSSTDLPHYYPVNSVSYTGTHDNDTVLGWYDSASEEERDFCNRYLNRTEEPISYAMLRSLYGSVSKMTIATMQDLLQLDTSARMNIPSTLGGNWVWRMQEGDITQEVEDFLLEITELYDRSNEQL